MPSVRGPITSLLLLTRLDNARFQQTTNSLANFSLGEEKSLYEYEGQDWSHADGGKAVGLQGCKAAIARTSGARPQPAARRRRRARRARTRRGSARGGPASWPAD